MIRNESVMVFRIDFQVPGTVATVFQSTNQAATTQGPIGSAAFITELDTSLVGLNQVHYSTYLGGTGFDISVFGSHVAGTGEFGTDIDVAAGKVYVTGAATSPDFPTRANACQKTNNSSGVTVVTSPVTITFGFVNTPVA